MRKPHATKQDYELAFKGFHYPMSRAAILNMGRDKGGIDREVASILGLIPNSSYKNENEIREAVRNVYRSRGIQDEDLPL
ncbi:MAG: hypothetical protein MK036_01050 [Dehalococcoidia bacterium]|jgi:hypothetical protein|nr:hypothetical protein [Chloroflexota bacterium]MBO40626.1 hypothetical protein [Chloroflexota bacterium]MCH2520522.1 hypothetical protein [Dehalococcoidia bacterium]MEC7788636.1 hypothetical protein [Chloroflexota bacterium]|tara:strand:- start:148 stop:387 length:240 start_codon:yes stop_codon:yes gene_type:complete